MSDLIFTDPVEPAETQVGSSGSRKRKARDDKAPGDEPRDDDENREELAWDNTARKVKPRLIQPSDIYRAPKENPEGTIFYLTVRIPHNDTWAYHGPHRSFQKLLPEIHRIISPHPGAVKKWNNLVKETEEYDEVDNWVSDGHGNAYVEDKGLPFKERGFTRFVVEHEEDGLTLDYQYSVLRVERKVDKKIFDLLPGPVYTVSTHGPLLLDFDTKSKNASFGGPRGWVATSKLIGSYETAQEAQEVANGAMDKLLEGEEGVFRQESWEELGKKKGKGKVQEGKGGKGRGMVLAMSAEKMWEIWIDYDSDVLGAAMDRFEEEKKGETELTWG